MEQATSPRVRPIAPPFAVMRPTPVLLSRTGAPRRIAARPLSAQGEQFAEQFDDDTLAFDCFRVNDTQIALSGPSLLNLGPTVAAMRVMALPSETTCRVSTREMDRHARILVEAPPGTTDLVLHLGEAPLTVRVGENGSDIFAGRRVLFTLSKDNQLSWITDWVRFAVTHHGADAVLVYDNGSTAYSAATLLETLAAVPGIKAAVVVEWPFKYGPAGIGRSHWDSDFCQLGSWEHARWRFLSRARSVQNADVDELVVSRSGRSVFEAAEADLFGIVSYAGRWVIGTAETAIPLGDPARRHHHYQTVLRPKHIRKYGILPVDPMRCPPKWTLVPARCPAAAQWGVHSVFGWLPSRRLSSDFGFRHFREISNNWKYARMDRPPFAADAHEHDAVLARYFAGSSDASAGAPPKS